MRKTFVLLLWSFAFAAAGQQTNIQLSGTVKDTAGNALPGATVILVRLADQAGLLFTTTDTAGRYFFAVPPTGAALAVKVSLAGFLKQQQPIVEHKRLIHFFMRPSEPHLLPNVTVTNNRRPIVQKGDTLSYDAAHFTERSDRHLGDIIKKLPGVEVDDAGVIKYKGKEINKFYIEGDDLLGGRYTIATDNINAADIDKVQIIEHNQDVKMLNGIVPSNRAGVNVLLKPKSKLKMIHNAELTGGLPKAYAVEGKSMAFRKKFKAINEIKLNDMGTSYTRESGIAGLQEPRGIEAGRALFNNSRMFNINDLYKLNPATGITLNGFYIKDRQRTGNEFRTLYYLPNGDRVAYSEDNQNQLATNALHLGLTFAINSPKTYFKTASTFDHNRDLQATATITGNRIKQHGKHTSTSISNTAGGYLLIGKKHLLHYGNTFSYSSDPKQSAYDPGVLPQVINDSIPYLQTIQHLGLKRFQDQTTFSYSRVFANWTLGLNTGFNWQRQQLQSRVALLQSDSLSSVPAGFGNALNWKKSELFSGAQLTYSGNRSLLILNAPLKWQHYHYSNDSVADNKDAGARLTSEPALSWEYRVGKEHTLALDYHLDYKTAGIEQVYGGAIISGYRNFASYETPFLMSRSHTLHAGFGYKKIIRMLFAAVDLQYAATKSFFMYSTTIKNDRTVVQALPIINQYRSGSVSARAGKYIFALNTTIVLDGSLRMAGAQQLQNEQLFSVFSRTKSVGISVAPTVLKWLKLDLSSGYTQYSTTSAQAGFRMQKLRQWKQQSGITVYPANGWSMHFSNQYYYSVQKGNPVTSNLFMDAYAQYKFDKRKLLLRLSCSNIANVNHFRTLGINDNQVSSTSYLLRPRMLCLLTSFDF
ncbi:carboxypeptidase-like regulatory domain-containing protein [Niabella aurantiaca]|uniref:carboxypeptidase-like regulatory domain-containing protein n=1 Tax=Niabella aurantiaca TaxID=379900 RepID=UPI00035DF38F|nr:carboxypeptidase-like regulatory domain-containing protein [Niabella aurantiaca]